MELRNILEITTLLKNNVHLYAVSPYVSGGKIQRKSVKEVTSVFNYRWALDVLAKGRSEGICIFRKGIYTESISKDDEINTSVRVFTTREEAESAMKDAIKMLSYKAIESVNHILEGIKERKKALKKQEDKYKELKKEYFEISISKFSR